MVITKLLCLVIGHKWLRTPYPDADTPDAYYLHCRRCSKDNHDQPSGVNHGGMAGGF